MQQIILKKELSQTKIKALLSFLKSWGVDAEIKSSSEKITEKKKSEFSLNIGLWKDIEIDSNELRKQAWKVK